MTLTKRILLSAFECNPYMGSDAEVGWQWAKQLSQRGFDITVVTRKTHKAEIEKMVQQTGDCSKVNFVYVDIEWLYPITELFNPRNHIYYYFWQLKAMFVARRLNMQCAFDLIHHVTWVSFRQPSFMGLLGVPMYFGPVAGGDEILKGYAAPFSFKRKLMERFRTLVNSFVKFDPLMWLTYHKATKVFFTSEAHLKRVPHFVSDKAQVELAIGTDFLPNELETSPGGRQGNRLLFVGRFLGWKGMDIGLRAFAHILDAKPDTTLTVVGDGEEKERWQALAQDLGLSESIEWLGWLPKAEVLQLYEHYDVFFFPSLRDSGGFVVLEALQKGMPVVCFNLGGPGVLVDSSCGVAVEPVEDLKQVAVNFASATLKLLANGHQLTQACKERVNHFTWDKLISRIYGEGWPSAK